MSVLLSDRMLAVRHRVLSVADAHGDRFAASWGARVGPWPGRASEGPDVPVGQVGGRSWVLAVDPEAWPLEQGDLVEELNGNAVAAQWLVNSADLMHHTVEPWINYIRVEAHARLSGAAGVTEP